MSSPNFDFVDFSNFHMKIEVSEKTLFPKKKEKEKSSKDSRCIYFCLKSLKKTNSTKP